MRKLAYSALVALLAGCAVSGGSQKAKDGTLREASHAELEAYCASGPTPPCRRDVSFNLVQEDGSVETYRFELMPPPLQSSFISILPGETLYVFGKFIGGELILPKVSYQPPPAGQYLKFAFEQNEGEPSMMLSAKSTYDHAVKYRLVMMRPESEQMYKTSSCPVSANMAAFEQWPHPIFQLMVIRITEHQGGMTCTW